MMIIRSNSNMNKMKIIAKMQYLPKVYHSIDRSCIFFWIFVNKYSSIYSERSQHISMCLNNYSNSY